MFKIFCLILSVTLLSSCSSINSGFTKTRDFFSENVVFTKPKNPFIDKRDSINANNFFTEKARQQQIEALAKQQKEIERLQKFQK